MGRFGPSIRRRRISHTANDPKVDAPYLHFNMSYERKETRVSCARRERGGRRTTAIPGYKVIRSLNSWLNKIFMEFSWTVSGNGDLYKEAAIGNYISLESLVCDYSINE